jgi:hypothetical protein
MQPMEKSVTFTGACANEIIPSINRSLVYKAKEGRHVRINNMHFSVEKLSLVCNECGSLHSRYTNLHPVSLYDSPCTRENMFYFYIPTLKFPR